MNCANHPDRERLAFCQNCGKPLCRECARTVGQAVFCEPCLEARLAAANAATPPPIDPHSSTFGAGPTTGSVHYQTVPGSGQSYRATGTVEGIPYSVSGVPPRPGTPNPVIAVLLGFVPGVGAMYNGQYAKGIVHLIVFAVLVSLAHQNGIFGLFVAAWIFYQAIEAYHTARARRDGTPQPNPFGLNDIGERFGFGRAWPGPGSTTSSPAAAPSPDPVYPAPPPWSSAGAPVPQPTATSSYAAPPFPGQSPFPGQPPFSGAPPYPGQPPAAEPFGAAEGSRANQPYRTAGPAATAFTQGAPPPVIPTTPPLPIGALVLIGLGTLFLLGNSSWFGRLPTHILLPALLIGVGVWIFVRRMTRFGTGLIDDGSPAYRLRVLRALQGSIWVVLVGVLFLLDSLRILSWAHSWPLFIIVAGVMIFLQRSTAIRFAQSAVTSVVPPPPAAGRPEANAPASTDRASERP